MTVGLDVLARPSRNVRTMELVVAMGEDATGELVLLYQTHSPYARKVLVFAHEAGLAHRLRIVHHETSPTNRNAAIFAVNPLGKVPVLILPDQFVLFDSTVICEYLGTLSPAAMPLPSAGLERWAALRLQALAQGMCEAGIAVRWETERRPEQLRYPAFRDGQMIKLIEAYDFLEHEADLDSPVNVGQIAIGTCLDWLIFRGLPDFRPQRPRLARWYHSFVQRSSMQATTYQGQTMD